MKTIADSNDMKFTVNQSDILPCLAYANGAIANAHVIPILGNVLIDATGERITLTGTDLEIQIVAHCDAHITKVGSVTVSAKKLLSLVKLLPSGEDIQFFVTPAGTVSVRSGRSRYTLSTQPSENYPQFDSGAVRHNIDIPAAELMAVLQSTAFAAARNDVRYYLNGVAMQISGGTIRAAASNGHQLAVCERAIEDHGVSMDMVILPLKAVEELLKALKRQSVEDTVSVQISDNSIMCDVGEVTLHSKLILGQFPDYARVIPDKFEASFTVDRKEMKSAILRAAIVSSENTTAIKLKISGIDGMLMSCVDTTQDASEETVPIIEFKGRDIIQGYKSGYLLDAINNDNGESSVIEISDTGVLMVQNEQWKCVVMPMRI